ncbi:hypothetical protein P3T22_006751, partial [Paraburkholderia sp. GAS348]
RPIRVCGLTGDAMHGQGNMPGITLGADPV